MDQNALLVLTADVVAAHVSNNRVAIGDVGDLVKRVHDALAGLGEAPEDQEPQAKVPVVSIRASVKPDYIVCMECGKQQTMLKRHLAVVHSMSPTEYRRDYGLPNTYPMVAPNYSDRRRALAVSIGLGRKKAEPEATAAPKTRGRKPKADAGA